MLRQLLKLSTADLPERERLAIWREVYGRFIFNVDIEPIGNGPFEAEVALRRLPRRPCHPDGARRRITSSVPFN
jgi:hypothetical protein